MSQVAVILALIQSEPGLTDQEIRRRLSLKFVAHVNQTCRRLEARWQIQRIAGSHGQIVNVPGGVAAPTVPNRKIDNGAVPAGEASAAGGPAVAERWQQVARLDLARTLLVLPCSAAKRSGGAVATGPKLADVLPPALGRQLTRSQEAAAPKAKLDSSALLPAWRRYRGAFYQAAGPALQAAVRERAHLLILSGCYGVLLAEHPIGVYDAVLRPGWWPDHVLQACLVAYAARHGLSAMVAFAGGHTPYANVVRRAAWGANGVDQAFLLSPTYMGQGAAMGVVPGALGEAFAAFWSRTIGAGWISTEGLGVAIERLS